MQLEEPSLALAQVQVQVLVLGQGPKLWLQAVAEQLWARLQGRQGSVMTCRHRLLDMLSGSRNGKPNVDCSRQAGDCQKGGARPWCLAAALPSDPAMHERHLQVGAMPTELLWWQGPQSPLGQPLCPQVPL